MTRGLLISFEGPEGGGKSTQLARLAARLRTEGADFIACKEPGGTRIGDEVRGILLDPTHADMTAECEFFLYSASRAQLCRTVILPALQAGKLVLCDRFFHSTLAYQGHGRGLSQDFLQTVTREATAGLSPDLTVFLDVSPEEGLARARQRGGLDRLEQADLSFHERLRAGFLQLSTAEEERSRWLRLDGLQSQETLSETIWQRVIELLDSKEGKC